MGQAFQDGDPEHVAPRSLPRSSTVPEIAPPEPNSPEAGDGSRIVVPALNGIRLVASADRVRPDGGTEPGVTLDGVESPDAVQALDRFLGKPLRFDTLGEISRVVVAFYRARGKPFVDVAFPEQDLSRGVLQAVVTEFRVGDVRIEGSEWFSAPMLRRQVRLQQGDAIDAERLHEDLVWLNRSPFRQVTAVAAKGSQTGETDLTLKVDDRFPFAVYGGYANNGPPALTRDRWSLGFNWGNAFWSDQQLSYQLTTSGDFWRRAVGGGMPEARTAFEAHAVSYEVGLPWRHRIVVSGSYYRAVPRLGPDLGLVGVSGEASMGYVIGLRGPAWLDHQLQAGFTFKSTNNNLAFGGIEVSDVTSEVNQFSLVYAAAAQDRFGQTLLRNALVYSPGGLTPRNTDEAFAAQADNPFAKARYVYDRLDLTRVTTLPEGFSWVARFSLQIGDRNLLPSEQLQAGGADTVRGYPDNAGGGSHGLLLTQEVRAPVMSPLRRMLGDRAADQLQFLAFWDYAVVRNRNVAPAKAALSGIGLGVRYTLSRYVDLRFDYGWQLKPITGAVGRNQFAHLAVTLGY